MDDAEATPPLRVVLADDSVQYMTVYPDHSSVDPSNPYFPPKKRLWADPQNQPTNGKVLCGVICFKSITAGSNFFVLWGLGDVRQAAGSEDFSTEQACGSPWCRVLDWKDIMSNMAPISNALDDGTRLFRERGQVVMKAFSRIHRPGYSDFGLRRQAETWAGENWSSTHTNELQTEEGAASGAILTATIQRAKFLGRDLLQLSIRQSKRGGNRIIPVPET